VVRKLQLVAQELLCAAKVNHVLRDLLFSEGSPGIDNEDDTMETAMYYREILDKIEESEVPDVIHLTAALESLLESHMVLEHQAAGKGARRREFLCAKIADQDLPWDLTETDW